MRLGRLGALLLDAGLSVTEVRARVSAAADVAGLDRLSVSVLPEDVLLADDDTGDVSMVKAPGVELSMRQTALAVRLAGRIVNGTVAFDDIAAQVDAVRATVRRYRGPTWVAGAALVSAGLALVFRCPWWAIATSLLFGGVVGLCIASVRRTPASVAVLPFVTAVVSTALVGGVDRLFGFGPIPLFAVCAPVAILVPGALITNALLELTAADVVTGASRLMYGITVLGFMTVGIKAGAELTGVRLGGTSASNPAHVPRLSDAASGWQSLPPVWVSWLGVVLLAVGIGLAFGAGVRLSAVTLVVMVGVYAMHTVLGPHVGDIAASGIIAGVVYLASYAVERTNAAIPSVAFFFPAFLLLVPGTVGLVALASSDPDAIGVAVGTFVSLCVGIKVAELLSTPGDHR